MTRDLSAGVPETELPDIDREPGHLDAGSDATNRSAEPDSAEDRDFTRWLESHQDELVRRWVTDATARLDNPDERVVELLAEFYRVTLRLLAGCFGPYRSQFEPLLRRLAELYGSLGAMRSLAAGEIIEEVQFLREAFIRLLFVDPPELRGPALLIREVLRLNRVVDSVVTFASVGHTDALFFALFQGSGAPRVLSDELRAEVEEQLAAIQDESERLSGHLERS